MSPSTSTSLACPLDSNVTYTCTNPYPNCTNTAGLDFPTLWTISLQIANACPTDWRLFDGIPGRPTLNQAGCEQLVGKTGAQMYEWGYIWTRLMVWKYPLFQLVVLLPRPPLGIAVESFVMVRLLGNPIGTIQGYLYKLASCQRRAVDWKRDLKVEWVALLEDDDACCSKYNGWERKWRALTLITNSYDEWGLATGTQARTAIHGQLQAMGQNERRSLLDICQRTSDELARDRSTKLLPIVVAQVFFIISIGLAFLKSDVAPTHTIALSALHLWLIPAVFLSAVIGVSQTENSIPEILKRFQEDINRAFGKQQLVLPDVDAKRSTQTRRTRGGIYSWQAREIYEQCAAPTPKAAQNPQNTASQAHNPQSKAAPDPEAQHTPSQAPAPATAAPSTRTTLLHLTTHSLLPSLPLLAAATTSVAISWLVPPLGYNCRTTSELVLTLWWLLLLATDFHPALRASFARTLFKDTLGTLCTAAVVLVTQAGAMNSCKCYSLSGTVGVVLPAHPLMAETAGQRMALTFACIALQVLVVPVVMGGWFADAVRVFVQRDDGGGDWHWWHWVCGFFAGWGPLGRWKGRAVGRGNAEYELVERRRRSG